MSEKSIAASSRRTLEANFGPLRSAPDDLLNSRRDPFISFQPAGITVVAFVTRLGIGLGAGFAQGQGLCEALVAQIGAQIGSRA
jgi:hypothetical protein